MKRLPTIASAGFGDQFLAVLSKVAVAQMSELAAVDFDIEVISMAALFLSDLGVLHATELQVQLTCCPY